MSEENDLTLMQIATGATLPQILEALVLRIEVRHPGSIAAIFLLEQHDNTLHIGAGPHLPPHFFTAIDAEHPVAMPDLHAFLATDDFASSRFHAALNDWLSAHALHASVMTPIRAPNKDVLGFFIVCNKKDAAIPALPPTIDSQSVALAAIAISRDLAEDRVKQAENRLRDSETLMAQAIEGSGTGIWDRNVETGEIYYSTGWKAMLGYADSDISNRIEDSYTRVHPDDLAYVQAAMQAHFAQMTPNYDVEHRIRCKNGSYKWISSRGKVVSRQPDGTPLRMIGTSTDISALRALSERLQHSVDLVTSLTNEVPGLVYQYQQMPNGQIFFTYVSEGIRDIYELTPEQVIANASLINQAIHPEDLAEYCISLNTAAASLTPWHLAYRVLLPRQGLRWRQGDARPRRLQDGSTLWHGFITDVTERKRIELELQEFATIDFLTQVPNRRYFMAQMEDELARIQRVAGTRTAVLMCDLDHFKSINDRFGHAVGDLVLKRFAAIVRGALRKNDFVGRVGGEEFAIVLAGVNVAEATSFAQRLQAQIAQTPLLDDETALPVTISIGITAMRATDTSADAALSRSDSALYQAKNSGRDRIEVLLDEPSLH